MLALNYFKFFTPDEMEQLDLVVQQNYVAALDHNFFYLGHTTIPDVSDIMYDRKKRQLRQNVKALLETAATKRIQQQYPEIQSPVEFDLLRDDLLDVMQQEYRYDISQDVMTLLYMRNMCFREGSTINNPTLIGVW